LDARTFLDLRPTDDPLRFGLVVTPGLCTPGQFLFGGCGLAAGIEAMEAATGRPCIWATAQYLSYAAVGSALEFEVIVAVNGHQVSQARAVGRVAGNEILTVNAALGRRPGTVELDWAVYPNVPAPDDCPSREMGPRFAGTVLDRIEVRLAQGRQFTELDGSVGDGHCSMWARMPEVLDASAASLAVFGDLVPNGVAQGVGVPSGGNSLDNTLRIARLAATDWVLVNVQVHAIHGGFGHGSAQLFAEDGTFLGTASQSFIVRAWNIPRSSR
jgi:acyl-CoA thioesterase